MLRPACWLPPQRLLTPRLAHASLLARLGSATRRSGAYRGGTCTRWRRTTGCGRLRVRLVTTHHGLMLSGPYKVPALKEDVYGIYTNTTPVEAYRGAGRPEATLMLERMLDLL